MLFNSLEYFFFLPFVFLIYWGLKKVSYQNVFILLASYFFYGLWDYRFLSLIFISSLADYLIGISLEKSSLPKQRKILLTVSVLVNLGILGVFKYYGFFASSLADLFGAMGLDVSFTTLKIVLPVGISFYTFQTMSYTIDIYRGKMQPTRSALNFFTYVAFFPQLVAGPIERAVRLLPQIENKRIFTFEKGRDGLKQILWGLFLKVVVADSCGEFVDQIFGRADGMNAPLLLLGAVLFSFQIYGDFAGYSEIAIGSAKLLGIDLMKNFRTPYFSRDIAEFWRRWHISLSTWFRDYLYIPLGGSRVSKFLNIRNVFLVFVISGFWHGANWTFIIWGFLHALFYLPLLIGGSNRNSLDNIAQGRLFPRFTDSVRVLGTFLLVSLAWIFFRAENLTMAFDYISGLSNWSSVKLQWIDYRALVLTAIYILLMVVIEWINRNEEFTLQRLPKNMFLRYPIYLFLSLLVVQYFSRGGEFIYFQF